MTKSIMLYWLPVIVYGSVIFFLSAGPQPDAYVALNVWDKAAHIVEYAVLAVLAFRAFRYASTPALSAHASVLAIACSALYGVSDEIHQIFVPSRMAAVSDAVADFIGSCVGVLLWQAVTAMAVSNRYGMEP
jgi:VanZ family protein